MYTDCQMIREAKHNSGANCDQLHAKICSVWPDLFNPFFHEYSCMNTISPDQVSDVFHPYRLNML